MDYFDAIVSWRLDGDHKLSVPLHTSGGGKGETYINNRRHACIFQFLTLCVASFGSHLSRFPRFSLGNVGCCLDYALWPQDAFGIPACISFNTHWSVRDTWRYKTVCVVWQGCEIMRGEEWKQKSYPRRHQYWSLRAYPPLLDISTEVYGSLQGLLTLRSLAHYTHAKLTSMNHVWIQERNQEWIEKKENSPQDALDCCKYRHVWMDCEKMSLALPSKEEEPK